MFKKNKQKTKQTKKNPRLWNFRNACYPLANKDFHFSETFFLLFLMKNLPSSNYVSK